jgi:eukaryotic-like serine/threonine-protein kinase
MREAGPSRPRALARYSLFEQIAAGGMATVHLGRLVGPVGFARTVAIKKMLPQVAEDPELVSMFVDEARVAARIHHPNVVPTLDVVADGGELLIVMEYVRGESLARLLRAARDAGERMPVDIAVSIVVGVLHGLHAAHVAKGEDGEPLAIVHRDVSPHNVLVGVDGVPRVLDFGIAKAARRVQTTRKGQVKGKLAYMAPEQIQGEATCATDVYAASIVLWEALTGRRLFDAENDGQLLQIVLRGCTEPPSAYALDVPPALDVVVLRGLDLDPAKRFASARDMAMALEETTPPVAASRIGQWVASMAKETLERRSERIALMEREGAGTPTGGDEAGGTGTGELVLTGMAGVVPSTPPRRPRKAGARSLAIFAVVAAVAFVVAARQTRTAAGVTPTPSPTPMPSPTPTPSPSPTPTPTPMATPSPTPGPFATASAATPRGSVGRVAPSGSASAAPPASSCDPPYYFDARGLRLFKKGCM